MISRNTLHLFIAGFVVLVLVASFWLWAGHQTRMDIEQSKPYVTYSKLFYAAEICESYKVQYATWPTNLAQLAEGRPEFGDPLDKDAWGRQVVLTPYNPELGYGSLLSFGRDGQPGGTGPDRDFEIRFPMAPNAERNKREGAGLTPPQLNP